MKVPLPPTKELLKKRLFLVLPLAPSVNHCYITTRWGKRILSKDAKEWFRVVKDIIVKELQNQQWGYTQQTKLIAEIMTYYPNLITRDTHNQYKTLCDAFEDYIIDNDCYLLIRQADWEIDKENPRLEIIIRAFNPETDKWHYENEFRKENVNHGK